MLHDTNLHITLIEHTLKHSNRTVTIDWLYKHNIKLKEEHI